MLFGILRSSAEAMKNYRLPSSDLRKLQTKKLRRMLRYCYDNVPLYHTRFREAGLLPDDIASPECLQLLPALSPDSLRGDHSVDVTVPGARVGLVKHTSGTLGPPIRVTWSRAYADLREGLNFRRTWVDGVRPWHKAAVIWTASPGGGLASASRLRRRMALAYKSLVGAVDLRVLTVNQVELYVTRNSWGPVASTLHSFQPSVVYARPTAARRLGIRLRSEGRSVFPKILLSAGEFLSDSMRAELANLYSCDVFDCYGTSEMGGLGFECPEHSGMHLNSDCFVFEVQRNGKPVSQGESGEMVITALHNDAMPLLRYEQGDRVVLEKDEKCNCGSYLPRLRSIQGRMGDGLVTTEGIRIPLGVVCSQLEKTFAIRDFQLTQRKNREIVLKLVRRFNTKETTNGVSAYLKGLVGGDPAFEVQEWSEAELPVKYRPVVSEITS